MSRLWDDGVSATAPRLDGYYFFRICLFQKVPQNAASEAVNRSVCSVGHVNDTLDVAGLKTTPWTSAQSPYTQKCNVSDGCTSLFPHVRAREISARCIITFIQQMENMSLLLHLNCQRMIHEFGLIILCSQYTVHTVLFYENKIFFTPAAHGILVQARVHKYHDY